MSTVEKKTFDDTHLVPITIEDLVMAHKARKEHYDYIQGIRGEARKFLRDNGKTKKNGKKK